MLGKLTWRAGFVGRKLGNRMPNVPWSLVWDMLRNRHGATAPLPEVETLEEDAASNMVRLRVGHHEFWYPAEASREGLDLVYSEVFDPNAGHFYEYEGAVVRPDDVVCDAGACEGFFTRYTLDRGARVLAVEPWSRMAEAIERTFPEAVRDGRLKVVRVFLGASEGSSELGVDLAFPFMAQETRSEQSWTVRETVPVVRLDNLIEQVGWDRLDFLKMDIEGGERDALSGATGLLRRSRPRLSVTTYHRADDCYYLRAQIRDVVADYRFAYKGLVEYPEGGVRPIMLHGWPASSHA
jgi:FkbM family methyltransferase